MSVTVLPRPGWHQDVLDELGTRLFASLHRRDQRRKGIVYLYGLLTARGRKSMRNIAAAVRGHATEQNMHHFISDSTWGWTPVRQALTDYVVTVLPPEAWVVRHLVIPKAGNDSVGVGVRFSPSLGQALNAQHALGVWAASEEVSSPVNWRLHLPQDWVRDKRKRRRASIPDGVAEESITDCVLEVYLEVVARAEVPARPLVLDARCLDLERFARRLHEAGTPWLARIGMNSRLTTGDVRLPGLTSEPVSAYQLASALTQARRPLTWTNHEPVPAVRTDVVAVAQAGIPGVRDSDLHLIGTGPIGQPWPAQLWLTDLGETLPLATLLQLSKLLDRVDRDAVEIGDRVGLRDFSGRSFTGWHRHATLASAAHALYASTYPETRLRLRSGATLRTGDLPGPGPAGSLRSGAAASPH